MLVADYLLALNQASTPPIDWRGVMEAKMNLDSEATTVRQKTALANLSCAEEYSLRSLIVAVMREFPTPFFYDATGWQRLNPAFQRSKRRR